MPRPATVLLGLTLVAFSIGFNTAKYPVVWEMVGPATASESAKPVVVSQMKKPEEPQPSQLAEPIEVKPTPEVGDQVVIDHALPAEDKPTSGGTTANPWELQKPLVPVMAVCASGATRNAAAGGEEIRRLPPVDASHVFPICVQTADGTIPIYPTTGIE